MSLPILGSPRLLLRDWYDSDAEALWSFAKDPRVGPDAGWRPHRSIQESYTAMTVYQRIGVWAVALKETDLVIGTLELSHDGRRKGLKTMEIGYALSPAYWGEGLMAEAVRTALCYAFEEKKAQMVSAYCQPKNTRSVHLLESCGFSYEGTLRGMYLRFDGVPLDMNCYSILPNSFAELDF